MIERAGKIMSELDHEEFKFLRSRGIVWVCDLANSSHYLNDNGAVGQLETFLPRFYWISNRAVQAAGGRLIKWAGDGFLAWFETPLHRLVPEKINGALTAAWYLTLVTHLTQLGVPTRKQFRLRHGITYEHDALVMSTKTSVDIIGRAVVLAFRLSGLPAPSPNLITDGEIYHGVKNLKDCFLQFERLELSPEDHLRFFKGEKWGTHSLYVSSDIKTREASPAAPGSDPRKNLTFVHEFLAGMMMGPAWSKGIALQVRKTALDR